MNEDIDNRVLAFLVLEVNMSMNIQKTRLLFTMNRSIMKHSINDFCKGNFHPDTTEAELLQTHANTVKP